MARYQLQFFNLERQPGQDYCLRIPVGNVFGPIIDAAFPSLEHIPWRAGGKGVLYTYLKKPSDEAIFDLRSFLVALTHVWTLTCPAKLECYRASLDACFALSLNMNADLTSFTEIGQLERDAKYRQDSTAGNRLIEKLNGFIQAHPLLRKCDGFVPIPAHASKPFHLPLSLANGVTDNFGVPRRTILDKPQDSRPLKNLALDEKLREIKNAFRVVTDIRGHSLIVLDDLYQSGCTMWAAGHALKAAGAAHVFGLACVKSMRDTDNA